jgi:hypothetical protein
MLKKSLKETNMNNIEIFNYLNVDVFTTHVKSLHQSFILSLTDNYIYK